MYTTHELHSLGLSPSSFHDRKLNRCDHCGTNKQIAAHFDVNGRMYFLCVPATFILESMMKSVQGTRGKRP